MKITRITAHIVKVPKEYRLAGQTNPTPTLPLLTTSMSRAIQSCTHFTSSRW